MSSALPASTTRPSRAGGLPPACLLGLVAFGLLLGLQAIEPFFFLRDDNATHFLPAYVYTYETVVLEHELPLLNQHQDMGGTFLASGQTGVFFAALYPVYGLLRILAIDARHLIDTLATLHLVLAALGMWWLLRQLEIPPALAFPLALCWSFLPFAVIAGRSWIFVTYLMAFLPFNLWLLLRFLARPSASLLALLVALKTLYFFTGYVHYMVLASLFEGIFLLLYFRLQPGRRWRGEAMAMALMFALTALLSAPLVLPMLAAKALSSSRSQALPADTVLSFPLQPLDFLGAQLFLPQTGYFFRFGSTIVFFLGAPILLALLVGFRRRKELGRPLEAALGAGLFALAMSTLLYRLLYQLPVFDSLRFPFKSFPIAAFFFFPVAAAGAACWAKANPRRLFVAAALFWLNLVFQGICLLPAGWRAPFGPYQLDRSVAALRGSPLLQKIGDQSRVITVASAADRRSDAGPLRLGFLYATLAGKYQVQGYDPLIAKINQELIFPVGNNGEILVREWGWPAVSERLRACSARYLLVSAESLLLPQIEASPTVRRLAEAEQMLVLEDLATPAIVHRMEDLKALPFRWRTNGLELDLPPDFPGGRILFNLAALENYRLFLNGQDQGRPPTFEKRPYAELAPGPGHLELRYVDHGVTWGLLTAAAGLVILLACQRGEARLLARLHLDGTREN